MPIDTNYSTIIVNHILFFLLFQHQYVGHMKVLNKKFFTERLVYQMVFSTAINPLFSFIYIFPVPMINRNLLVSYERVSEKSAVIAIFFWDATIIPRIVATFWTMT